MEKPLLCVSDLDETLLGSDKKISSQNIRAILDLQRLGIPFTIATGRSHLQIREFIDILEIKIPVITCNGAVTSMPQSEEMLNVSYIAPSRAKEICAYCESNHLDYLMYTAHNICYTRESKRIMGYLEYNARLLSNNKKPEYMVPMRCMDDVRDTDFNEAIKILVLGDLTRLGKVAQQFNEDGILTIVSSGAGLIDIMAKGATKGDAVKALADRLNLPIERVAVFGDSPNDISMFEVAGIRVAVENAVEEIKKQANFITKSNNESGVARAISILFGAV